MEKTRGFRLRGNLMSVFQRFVRRRTKRWATYKRLKMASSEAGPFSKLCSLGRLLKHGARVLCLVKRNWRYMRVGQEPIEPEKECVPEGHLAVYVGEAEGATCRVVVPVFYFNHPLFANLLREAETVYGFDHPGGIQIPCRISEFENVRSRIASAADGDARHVRRSWRLRMKW